MCMYDTFGEYCGIPGKDVKAKLIEELENNTPWYTMASAACLGIRGIQYMDWLKKLKRPRTWPNELNLYTLCILFHRNALVFNSGHIWTTLEVDPGLPVSIIQEMCETVMLYLGNNLYSTLRRKPFTLDRPIQFHLPDIQRMRLLHCDIREHKLHLEICMDSEYELLLNEEEIIPLAEPKPELLPESATLTLFDADYMPPGADFTEPTIKTESFDNMNIIGHITNQPPLLAKQIKQEFIDMAAYNVLQKHTHECALNKFVQEHQSETGLRIKDVRTLITADNTTNIRIKSEPTDPPTDTHFKYSSTDNIKPVHVVTDLTSEPTESESHQEPLLVVTAATKESLNNPEPVNEPLLVVTSGLTLDQARITEYHPTNASTRWSHLLNRPVPVSPNDTPSNQSTTTVSQLVFSEPEIHISKAPPK